MSTCAINKLDGNISNYYVSGLVMYFWYFELTQVDPCVALDLTMKYNFLRGSSD